MLINVTKECLITSVVQYGDRFLCRIRNRGLAYLDLRLALQNTEPK